MSNNITGYLAVQKLCEQNNYEGYTSESPYYKAYEKLCVEKKIQLGME